MQYYHVALARLDRICHSSH